MKYYPVRVCGDYSKKNHEDPYQTTSISWKVRRFVFFVTQLLNSKSCTGRESKSRVSYDPGQWIVEKTSAQAWNSCLQITKLTSNLGYPPEAKHGP